MIPDYTGNRRQDSHRNILANPFVGLVFFVPGVLETLRVNGRATLSTDAELLASLETGGQPPKLALDIAIETAFVHCGKAPIRSALWDPSTWPRRRRPRLRPRPRDERDGRRGPGPLERGLPRPRPSLVTCLTESAWHYRRVSVAAAGGAADDGALDQRRG